MDFNEIVTVWQKSNINNIAALDNALDSFKVEFAYNSGKIENDEVTYHDTKEIFDKGEVVGYSGGTRALFEQQNQRLCFEFIKPYLIEKSPLSVTFIKEVHKVLTSGTYDERRYIVNEERPGEFKKHDYVVGENEIGASPQDVHFEIGELIQEVNGYKGNNILTLAAYFHCKFESIHPFADGNGRAGRTLMNYILLTHNYPPVIIFNDDKPVYFQCLDKFDQQGEIDAFVKFLEYQITKTWTKYYQRNNRPSVKSTLESITRSLDDKSAVTDKMKNNVIR